MLGFIYLPYEKAMAVKQQLDLFVLDEIVLWMHRETEGNSEATIRAINLLDRRNCAEVWLGRQLDDFWSEYDPYLHGILVNKETFLEDIACYIDARIPLIYEAYCCNSGVAPEHCELAYNADGNPASGFVFYYTENKRPMPAAPLEPLATERQMNYLFVLATKYNLRLVAPPDEITLKEAKACIDFFNGVGPEPECFVQYFSPKETETATKPQMKYLYDMAEKYHYSFVNQDELSKEEAKEILSYFTGGGPKPEYFTRYFVPTGEQTTTEMQRKYLQDLADKYDYLFVNQDTATREDVNAFIDYFGGRRQEPENFPIYFVPAGPKPATERQLKYLYNLAAQRKCIFVNHEEITREEAKELITYFEGQGAEPSFIQRYFEPQESPPATSRQIKFLYALAAQHHLWFIAPGKITTKEASECINYLLECEEATQEPECFNRCFTPLSIQPTEAEQETETEDAPLDNEERLIDCVTGQSCHD